MNFGQRCAKLRKEFGYTRVTFAAKLGIPQTTLRNYELGIHEPGHSFLIQVAKEFGVTTDYLLGLTENPYKEKPSPALTMSAANVKWQELQSNFEKLNETGQERVIEYLGLLSSKEEYQKGSEQKPVETVRVWQAARSADNSTPSGWVDMPKEEVEKIFNAPDADVDF